MVTNELNNQLLEIAYRIREMREIAGYTREEMAEKTDVSAAEYAAYEAGRVDFPFTFIHKCAQVFNIGITDLLEGVSARLSSYAVTRKGQGQRAAKEDGIEIQSLAPLFRDKIAEPYYVRYEYSEAQQHRPIHLTTHAGQEFDLILSGELKVQVGDHVEVLQEGDSIYYDSSKPHGMIAVGGRDCLFVAVVLPGEGGENVRELHDSLVEARRTEEDVCNRFVKPVEDGHGCLVDLSMEHTDEFNFAFDVVDAVADKTPDKLAMLHVAMDGTERRFTFQDMKRASNRCANYFKSLGIKRGDRVMLVLKRHYQFWFALLGLHKLGAIAIPATYQLQEHDFTYRFESAGVSAILCTADGDTAHQADLAAASCPTLTTKVLVGGSREGWHNFDEDYVLFSSRYDRTPDAPCGDDTMLMFFTSGTTGYPKIAAHSYKYALGHFATAKYWHCVYSDGLHFTISDTGWGKALWGKFYGQWLCESAVLTVEFDRFDASYIMPMIKKYNVTTLCAPPTIYRMMIKEDLNKYDFSSLKHITTAGEALNPEVFYRFEEATGLRIMEGFGQTETTLVLANLFGTAVKVGSMGKPVMPYAVDLVDEDGAPVEVGQPGEIVIHTDKGVPCGLFQCYYRDEEQTKKMHHDGLFHTGDLAWRDEDGYYWYVGRKDDVIKTSGYRVGPFEIESVIMELPYVLECGVSAAPDEVRGQIVKASIVLTAGTEPTEELKKEIQNYVKSHTAPYKYPRIVVFCDQLPKTTSGKIIRHLL
ncbi:MAG: AMP-binding protein [bacterium]|nr:AMP-binding protein [bacterium]